MSGLDTFRELKIEGVVQTTDAEIGYTDAVLVSPELRHAVLAETEQLRRDVRRLEVMNEAMIDAGKRVVAERDAARLALERRLNAEAESATTRAEAS